jgi:hypothetical protein
MHRAINGRWKLSAKAKDGMAIPNVSEDDCCACRKVRDASSRDASLLPLAPLELGQTGCSNAAESRASIVAKHMQGDRRIRLPGLLQASIL